MATGTRRRYIVKMDLLEDARDVAALATLVQRLVNESGNPEGFDALKWTTRWLNSPVPVLGGACPASYMRTPEGRAQIEALIARMQSGAYC